MFARFWILWAFIGLALATWIFWWAVRRGQFDDSRRAGLLPLDDVDPQTNAQRGTVRRGRLNLIILLSIAAIGVAISVVTIALAVGAGR
jgi:cbb3-type cytochrome oxidase maturation protein